MEATITNMNITEFLFKLLRLNSQEEEISRVKKNLTKEVNATTKQIQTLNKAIVERDIASSIARAAGFMKE